jgi:hypothetical protein
MYKMNVQQIDLIYKGAQTFKFISAMHFNFIVILLKIKILFDKKKISLPFWQNLTEKSFLLI